MIDGHDDDGDDRPVSEHTDVLTEGHDGTERADARRRRLSFFLLVLAYFVAFRLDPLYRLLERVGPDSARFLHDWYLGSQTGSDALVVGRIKISHDQGMFSSFLQMPAFPLGTPGGYDSQFGLGAWLLAAIARLTGLDVDGGARVAMSVVALGNAILAALATRACARFLSTGAAVALAVGLLQPWPVAFGKSIYWMVALKCLPAALGLYFMSRQRPRAALIAMWAAAVAAFLSGYEYSTVVVALGWGAVVLVTVAAAEPLRQLVVRLVGATIALVSGFVTAVGIHLAQLAIKYDSFSLAWASFVDTFTKRTGASGSTVDDVYAASLAARPWTVLNTYLVMPVFLAPANLPFLESITVTAFLAATGTVVVLGSRLRTTDGFGQNWWAATLAYVVTLLGPLGWHLLARPHSYIHTPLNFILWFLPTIPLGLAVLWAPLRLGVQTIRADRVALALVSAVAACLALFFAYSWMSVR